MHSSLLLLLTLPAVTSASLIGTLLFGKDTLEPVRAAIVQTEQLRDQVYGWYHQNATQQGNFTVIPDPEELYRLLPVTYPGRSLVEADGSYYKDVEGWYKGDWTGWDYSTTGNRSLALHSRLNHTAAALIDTPSNSTPAYIDGVNHTALVQDRGSFDWLTERPVPLEMRLLQEHLLEGNVSLITGSLSFTAPNKIDNVDFSLEGLHFLPTGIVFLHALAIEDPHTTDVRTSLSLIPSGNNVTANQTVEAINKAFQLRIDMLQRIIDSGTYEGGEVQDMEERKHNCSLHIYGQFASAGSDARMQAGIDALESEMRSSTGITTMRAPPVELSLLAYSPDCQVVLSSARPLTGLLQAQLWRKTLHYASIYFLVLVLQTYLLATQMQATLTPSGLAKQSATTWLLQCVVDAASCVLHLSVAVGVENDVSGGLLACAFMAAVSLLAFGYRYGIVILREAMDSSSDPAPDEASRPSILTTILARITATTASSAPEVLRERRRRAVMLSSVLFFVLLGFFPYILALLLLPIVYSFWIPQIWRNIQLGTRRSVLKRSVIGLTCTRLFLPMYLLVCPKNVLLQEPSAWGWVLGGWMVVQAVLLVGQNVMGAHWFLRKTWVPQGARVWDYHPEAEGVYEDCAICLAAIESKRTGLSGGWLPNIDGYTRLDAEDFDVEHDLPSIYPPDKPRDDTSLSPPRPPMTPSGRAMQRLRTATARIVRTALSWKSIFNPALRGRRMDVMQAPCGHAFHTECLERWLEIKGECPSCRSSLPPV